MSRLMRTAIFEKVIKPLQNRHSAYQHKIMSNLCIKFNDIPDMYSFKLPLKSQDYDLTSEVKNITNSNLGDTFDNITVKDDIICFNVARDKYIKETLENNLFGIMPPLLIDNNKNIVVEFSSPNIAKPFHVGHFRSTIIGNYIANLNRFLQNQVTKINYLGDWGTQIGYIYLGLKMENVDDLMKQKDPIKTLYEVYVATRKLAENNEDIKTNAIKIFEQLELEDSVIYENWQNIKKLTILELKKIYERIGVSFDRYDWESMYAAKDISKVINMMEELQLIKLDTENRKVILINEDKTIPIIKSNGSTLYISRDIAAAIDRFEKIKFDAMYYVVDRAQTTHFYDLINILNKMKLPWVNTLEHVKFGRITGISTRKGTSVFINDVLDKAKELVKERQLQTKTTKVSLNEMDEVSDILALSGIIVQDLKHSRVTDYTFSWKSALDLKGDSGIRLQYTHCRLCNIAKLSGATLVGTCDSSLLKEDEVIHLITLISKFDEVVLQSYEKLEPCVLTKYLFDLCKAINKAIERLQIKGNLGDLGNQRLLLFHVARITLAEGMKLLGLTPLEEM